MREDRVVVHPGPVGGKRLSKVVRPWKPLPNISKMQIKLAVHDWLLLLFGLFKRYAPDITFWAWKNGKANAYVDYMFKRLRRQVRLGLSSQATDTIWILMRSHSYQSCCFNYVARGWYKTMKWSEVLKTMRQVKHLAKVKAFNIDFKRVYLEQPNKIRPLGVPTLAWRVYLHMYNNLITEWRMISETGKQHAYLPGKGVITAWEELLKRLEKAPNIYEADFKGFFDSISHFGLRSVLDKFLKFPLTEINFIERLNSSLIKLTKEDKLPERERDIPFTVEGALNPDVKLSKDDFKSRIGLSWESRIPGSEPKSTIKVRPRMSYEEFARWLTKDIVSRNSPMRPLTKEDLSFYDRAAAFWKVEIVSEPTGIWETLPGPRHEAITWGLSKIRPTVQWEIKDTGVPQGAPTSCSLATLVLRVLEAADDLIIYADDVIFFPKSSSSNCAQYLSMPKMGVMVNESKSLWAKKDGKWLVDYIKFVGFKYYPAKYIDTWQEAIGYPTLLMLFLDLLFINFPCFSVLWVTIVLLKRYERGKPRFTASTRSGATLEFGNREAFLSYLNTGRTLLLNTYYESKLSGESLSGRIAYEVERFMSIKSPIKLITESFIKKREMEHRAAEKVAKLFDKPSVPPWVPHIKLTGWFMARMQANSWDISVEQDFRLRWIAQSWLDINWVKYSWEHIIPKSSLNIFTASSFASHALLNASLKKRRRQLIRHVFVSSRELKGQIRKLRAVMNHSKAINPLPSS